MFRIVSALRALGLAAAAIALFAHDARAQDYPTRPVRMVVPFAPGGTTDVSARIVVEAMGKELGQNVYVENVGGAGGRTGTERVVKATPDGYTLLFGNTGPMAASKVLFAEQRYDPRTDLAPIGLVADVPMVIAASNKSEIKDLATLIGRMREKSDAITFGSAGFGATSDMAPSLLLHQTRLKGTIVKYQGAGPAIRDLTGGFIDAVIDQTVTLLPLDQGGSVKALAVSGPKRLPQAPNLPSFAEAGMPEFTMTVWNAISAPKGTPQPIVDKLVAALDKSFDNPMVKARFDDLAVPVPPADMRGPAVLQKLVDGEVDRWADVFKGIAKQ
jgi:tripartite-type tricarboxylate transporter receptor subunit TctC